METKLISLNTLQLTGRSAMLGPGPGLIPATSPQGYLNFRYDGSQSDLLSIPQGGLVYGVFTTKEVVHDDNIAFLSPRTGRYEVNLNVTLNSTNVFAFHKVEIRLVMFIPSLLLEKTLYQETRNLWLFEPKAKFNYYQTVLIEAGHYLVIRYNIDDRYYDITFDQTTRLDVVFKAAATEPNLNNVSASLPTINWLGQQACFKVN